MTVLLGSACSSDEASDANRIVPTPQPAPTVAGQPIEAFAPESTDRVAVIGLAESTGLSMYALPGEDNPLLGEIPASAEGIFGLGEAYETEDGAVWWLVRWDSLQGWVQPGLAYFGATTDITDEITGSADLVASSIDQLAIMAAGQYASTMAQAQTVFVASAEVSDDFAGTAIIDIVGIGNDSLAGYRLRVSGDGAVTNGTEFTLTSVQRVALCSRGASADGACS